MKKTAHEMILSYMKLTQNVGQVGYPTLNEAMELSWYKLFKKTKESFVRKWVYVANGIAKIPNTSEKLFGVFVFNHCGDLVPLYEDLIKNIVPPLPSKCSCTSCDHNDCLCSELDKDNISLVDVVIEGETYQNKYFTRILKNGDVVEEKHEWAIAYDTEGNISGVQEVESQSTKCRVNVKPCGCPIKSEENSHKLLSAGCIQHSCAPYLRNQYPAMYNEIGYYKVDEDNRQIFLFNSDGTKSDLTQVMLSYQSNGSDMLVPQYAHRALIALLDWTKKQYSPMFIRDDKRDAKKNYLWEERQMIKELNLIPYQFASQVGNALANSYYGRPHSDFKSNQNISTSAICDTSAPSALPPIVNNFYNSDDGTTRFLKKIVGADASSPVADTNTYQNDSLKNLGRNSADRVEIVVAGMEMYNWGSNQSFSLNKTTGTITFTAGYEWQQGASLKVDLRQ